MNGTILVTGWDPRLPYDRRELTALLADMLERARSGVGSGVFCDAPGPDAPAGTDDSQVCLELECLCDADMARLNTAAMGCSGPTNVLAFPDGEDGFLGSLALSVDTLEREVLLFGVSPARHCRCLLAHGVAHLLGYDHGPEMDSVCDVLIGSVSTS